MNRIPLRRPLGCLKNTFRQSRQQRQSRRWFAAPPPQPSTFSALQTSSPEHTFYGLKSGRGPTLRTAFAVFSPPPSPAPAVHPDPLAAYHVQQISGMDPTGARSLLFDRHRPDSAQVGDVLMVTTRRAAEPFSGVCLSVRRRGIDTAILLRSQLTKVGVEMWFKVYSRNVVGIEIIQRAAKRARRARLYYMRQAKHDRGSVEQVVREWRSSRNVLRTRGGAAAKAAVRKAGKGAGKGKKKV